MRFCYTRAVRKPRQTVTVVVEQDLLVAARKLARQQRTSVNQLVRDFLASLVAESNARQLAGARLKQAMQRGLIDAGSWKGSRDELYE